MVATSVPWALRAASQSRNAVSVVELTEYASQPLQM